MSSSHTLTLMTMKGICMSTCKSYAKAATPDTRQVQSGEHDIGKIEPP